MGRGTCSVLGCDASHESRGYCPKHYQQARRDGMQLLPTPMREHALSNVDLTDLEADCRACGTRVAIRPLGTRPVCEPNLLASRRERRRKELAEDRPKYNAYHREYNRRRKYNLAGGKEALARLLATHGGRCGICERELSVRTMRIDHDHACCDVSSGENTCGKCIRGVLCNSCNTGLGLLGDTLERAQAAVSYLTPH